MGIRSRRPPLERSQQDVDQVKYLVRHAEELDRNDILGWQSISATMPASQATLVVRHGLGRSYRHAFVTGVSSAAALPQPLLPSVTEAAGLDPKLYLVVGMYATVVDPVDFTMVVF